MVIKNLTIISAGSTVFTKNIVIKKFQRLNKHISKFTIGVRPQDVILKKTNKGKKIELI